MYSTSKSVKAWSSFILWADEKVNSISLLIRSYSFNPTQLLKTVDSVIMSADYGLMALLVLPESHCGERSDWSVFTHASLM